MTRQRALYLYNKHKSKTLSEIEQKEWLGFVFDKKEQYLLEEVFDQDWNTVMEQERESIALHRINSMIEEILVIPQRKNSIRKKSLPWFAIAVAASIILTLSGYFFMQYYQKDITPSGNYAQLTLPGGKKVELRSDKNGIVINADGVTYIDGSMLEKELQNSTTDMLVLETPRGGQYQVKLADGTTVFLNAASKLTYPTNFEGTNKREVTFEGEGYFDVFHNPSKPFLIISEQQTVEVKGTQFVVSAYRDEENVRTTLISGEVIVQSKNGDALLKPNQQSVLKDGNLVIRNVDVSEVLAWTKGEFVFNEEMLEDVMRKISRWYNVDVIFQNDEMRYEEFVGVVSRFDDIDKVISKLSQIGSAHFIRKGSTIVITKK